MLGTTKSSAPTWRWASLQFLFFAAIALARCICAVRWRFDSDEPQHLHVVWGWTQGLLPYRDLFDNHAPLFHMLYAPVYMFVGERPDILVWMRLAALPLYFLALWAVYLLGSRLFSRQAGFWAAVFTGLYPKFFLTSLEFRADDLWVVPWLLALAVLVRKPQRMGHWFAAGLLLGAALSSSMKTVMLLGALLGAALITLALERGHDWRRYLRPASALLAGVALLPLALVLFFAAQHALPAMYYDLVRHNIVPGLGHWNRLRDGLLFALVWLPLLTVGTMLIRHWAQDPAQRAQRTLVFLTYGIAILILCGFWPLETRQDFLPLHPLVIVVGTGLVLETLGRRLQPVYRNGLLCGLVLLEAMTVANICQPWRASAEPENTLLSEVLQLTRPGETIMDVKGETVFRPRPFFYELEGITRWRIRQGAIKDSIPEDVVRTETTVAAADTANFPSRGRNFLNANFLPAGQLRVAGRILTAQNEQSNGDMVFDIRIPARYTIVAENGAVEGLLDGVPWSGERRLNAGHHTLRLNKKAMGRLAVIWAPAVERGYQPFMRHPTI